MYAIVIKKYAVYFVPSLQGCPCELVGSIRTLVSVGPRINLDGELHALANVKRREYSLRDSTNEPNL